MKTIYYNGQVYTGEGMKEAFVVEDGKFVFVGSNEEALKYSGEKINLHGKFICSGFNDSHMHFVNYGNVLTNAMLTECTDSLAHLCEYLREFIEEHQFQTGTWVKGRGWNHDFFTDEKRMPNRKDLDKVSTEYPICITRVCGHCLVVNTKGLECLGIDVDDESVDESIRNGVFFDDTLEQVYKVIPAPSKEDIKNMIKYACKQLNSYGVTSCQSDDYCTFRSVPWKIINEAYKELIEENELTVRVYEQANFVCLDDLKDFINKGNNTGVGNEMFKIGPLKILGDGSLGARTAYLSETYRNDSSTRGMLCLEEKAIDEMVNYAHKHNMQVAIHTIGDQCLDVVLDAYDRALQEFPRDNHRHGIVHCQITRADQLKRMRDLNLVVYAQSIFLDYDISIIYDCISDKLASTSYSWKTLLDSGVIVGNGTDCPVELPHALAGIQCAVTRKNLKGTLGPYLPEQSFSIDEALKSYTIGGAYTSFEENIKGCIKNGYLADFVVLANNPLMTDVNKIKDIDVLETYLAGKCVYTK